MRHRNNFNGHVLVLDRYWFPTTPKWTLHFTAVGGRKRENTRKSDFAFPHDKTLRKSCPNQQLPAAKLFVQIFRSQSWTKFGNRCIFTILTTISVHATLNAVFPKLLHWAPGEMRATAIAGSLVLLPFSSCDRQNVFVFFKFLRCWFSP